uniref:DDE_3 domain-containing protein n=1 Tax=Haemonchus contortus TaxID=6289 RepID=A0A7I5EDS2_HAECO
MSEASDSSLCGPPLGHRVDRRENFHGRGRAQQPKPAAVATSGREKLQKTTSENQEPVPEVGDGMGRNNIRRQTPLVFVDKNIKINSETYQNVILRDTLLPWAQNHFGERNFVLQQDWAPAHGSKSTISFCRHHFPGFWDKDMWPSNSPDLNPMDYSVWSYLQQKVSSSPHRSLDSLKAALQMEWQKIDVDYLRPTVEAFTRRLEACILARGDHFEQYLE